MGASLLFSWLFMCTIFVLGARKTLMVSSQCGKDQQSLLLQFKNSLDFNRTWSTKLVKWDESLDCCSWDGVSCEDGRVTGLNLRNDAIFSQIDDSSSLFDLRHLRSLDLSRNYFKESMIPLRVAELTNLTYLNLSFAGFAGQIPIEMSHLRRLVTLDLSSMSDFPLRNSLRLENPTLSMLVQNLSELEELYFDGVYNLSSGESEWCHVLSSSLPRLRELSLSECNLSGFDKSLEKLRSLSVIRLDNNDFSRPPPRFFAYFSNLSTLSLKSCNLNGNFPHEIFLLPTLETLDISYNMVLRGSVPEFPENSALQRLILATTKFSGTLPTSIGNLWNLSTLDLSYCNFNGTLPSLMSKLTRLVFLDLSSNNFTGPMPSFKMSKGLNKIILTDNYLTGSIPSSLLALPSLKEVRLSSNRFDGQLHEFPNASSSILEILDLSHNILEGPIPMSIFELRKLSFLSLAFNNLNGTVHLDTIRSLGNLTTLDLSYNNLSVIPSANAHGFLSFNMIEFLGLASCKLKSIPWLRNQTSLTHLDLSANQLHGEIPSWIWEIGNGFLQILNLSHNYLVRMQEPYYLPSFVSLLDLSHNQLQGKIPIPTYARYVDLSSNSFTSIPVNIGNNLSFTFFLSISNNGLRGVIPESICNGNRLGVLDFSENILSGKVPKCMLAMSPVLEVLKLGRNSLNGPIPDTFSRACGLKTLDLNGNFIEGEVPKSLKNCAKLRVLDLGNNYIRDKFPCLLQRISTLQVLVLRSNRFFGHLKCPNANETWKKLQIIDLARNDFSGELQGHDLVEWKSMIVGENSAKSSQTPPESLGIDYGQSYQDSVTVTIKGQEMHLVKILTIYTCIDFSSNYFRGTIPEEIGELMVLYVLNLSNNAFFGAVPSSLGNLRQLESLDLSRNKLNGTIPVSLANLNFLSYLNLSFNQLVGRIPSGSQLQTFSANSYMGNEGLCGSPLTKNCTDGGVPGMLNNDSLCSETEIDWNLISAEIGFAVGFGIVVGSLVFCKRWRKSYFQVIEDVAFKILPLAMTRKWLSWTSNR